MCRFAQLILALLHVHAVHKSDGHWCDCCDGDFSIGVLTNTYVVTESMVLLEHLALPGRVPVDSTESH